MNTSTWTTALATLAGGTLMAGCTTSTPGVEKHENTSAALTECGDTYCQDGQYCADGKCKNMCTGCTKYDPGTDTCVYQCKTGEECMGDQYCGTPGQQGPNPGGTQTGPAPGPTQGGGPICPVGCQYAGTFCYCP